VKIFNYFSNGIKTSLEGILNIGKYFIKGIQATKESVKPPKEKEKTIKITKEKKPKKVRKPKEIKTLESKIEQTQQELEDAKNKIEELNNKIIEKEKEAEAKQKQKEIEILQKEKAKAEKEEQQILLKQQRHDLKIKKQEEKIAAKNQKIEEKRKAKELAEKIKQEEKAAKEAEKENTQIENDEPQTTNKKEEKYNEPLVATPLEDFTVKFEEAPITPVIKTKDLNNNKGDVIQDIRQTMSETEEEKLLEENKVKIKLNKFKEKKKNKKEKINNDEQEPEEEKLPIDPDQQTPDFIPYKYTVINKKGRTVHGTYDAIRESDVKAYLLEEGYEIVKIKTSKLIQILYSSGSIKGYKMSKKDLSFSLTQLSTYIKAGISIADSVKILANQSKKNRRNKKALSGIVYELTMGNALSTAMAKQYNVFPKLLINMIKTAEMTGDLPGTLDSMAEYYESIEKTRKQMISALTYPTVVFTFAILMTVFILVWVIPKFVDMFTQMNAELPWMTQFVINASLFLQNYYAYLILAIAGFITVLIVAIKNIQKFRYAMQYFVMHIPVLHNIIIYKEVNMFAKTFASLINHEILITDTMEILNKITDNEIYREIVKITIDNLNRGSKISEGFKGHWAFPDTAYQMLVTGERTGQLGTMMDKVANYYQEQHRLSVERIKSLIEPVMIVLLTVVVGFIVLSIVVPMFSLYENI